MEKQVMKLPVKPALQRLTRVAAYARVSSGKDAMLHSLAAQVSYYSDLIQKHPGWRNAGVYADEAMTGTKDNREEFQRLRLTAGSGKSTWSSPSRCPASPGTPSRRWKPCAS